MKKVLLDECCPSPLRCRLKAVEVLTVEMLGWKGRKNGDLIRMAEGVCDILVTADQSLRYQQNLSGRSLAIIELPPRVIVLQSSQSTRFSLCCSLTRWPVLPMTGSRICLSATTIGGLNRVS